MPTTLTLTLGLQAMSFNLESIDFNEILRCLFFNLVVIINILFICFKGAYREKRQKEIEEEQITPQSIASARFSNQQIGVSRRQVNTLLQRISVELERVTAERDALRAEVAEYRRREREQQNMGEDQDSGASSQATRSV